MLANLPSAEEAYEHENAFYLTCAPGRVGKLLAHYELYQQAQRVAGAFVECGIFKGSSLARFAMFRHLFESEETRALIGFDIFGKFPETECAADKIGANGSSRAPATKASRWNSCRKCWPTKAAART